MVELNPTIWRPTLGIGELEQSDNALITTQNGFIITTQDGQALQIQPGKYMRLAPTEWVESEGE